MFTPTNNVSILDEYISSEITKLTESNYIIAAVTLATARGKTSAADIEAALRTVKNISLNQSDN